MAKKKRSSQAYCDILNRIIDNLNYYMEKANMNEKELSQKMRRRLIPSTDEKNWNHNDGWDEIYEESYIGQVSSKHIMPSVYALTDIADALEIDISDLLAKNTVQPNQSKATEYHSGQDQDQLIYEISKIIQAYQIRKDTK